MHHHFCRFSHFASPLQFHLLDDSTSSLRSSTQNVSTDFHEVADHRHQIVPIGGDGPALFGIISSPAIARNVAIVFRKAGVLKASSIREPSANGSQRAGDGFLFQADRVHHIHQQSCCFSSLLLKKLRDGKISGISGHRFHADRFELGELGDAIQKIFVFALQAD